MGENQLPKVIAGVRFQDGTEIATTPTHNVA
jgi:putative transposase